MNSISNSRTAAVQTAMERSVPEKEQSTSKESKKSALQTISDYFEPRPDTTGDLPYSSKKSAAVGGALKGFFSLGVHGAVTGVASGVAGVMVGEETGSTNKAYLAGATVGAGTLLTTTAAMSAIAAPSIASSSILVSAASGAVAGATGSLIKQYQDSKEIEGTNKTKTAEIIAKTAPIAAGVATGAALGAINGVAGAVTGAIVGGLSGATGAYLSDKLSDESTKGDKIKTTLLAAGIGGSVGALGGAALTAATSSAPQPVIKALGGTAVIGGLTGTTSTISSSRLAETRDASSIAFTTGALTQAVTGIGGSSLGLAASIGSAIGVKGGSTAKKIALSAATGAALGAVNGSFAGPVGMAIGATMTSAISVAGALTGPKISQAIRNITADLQKLISPAMSKISKLLINKLGEKGGVITAGVISGALSGVPMAIAGGTMFGPIGAAVALVGSVAINAFKFSKIAKELAEVKNFNRQMEANGPSLEDVNQFMCQQAFTQIMPQLSGMSDKEKNQLYTELVTGSLKELQEKEKEFKKLQQNLSTILYSNLKEPLSQIKDKKEKDKFIAEQIKGLKNDLTVAMTNGILEMQKMEEEKTQTEQQK